MKILFSRFFWVFLTIMTVAAAIGGFYAAQFSVEYALAQDRSGGVNPAESVEFRETAEGFGATARSRPRPLQTVIFEVVQVFLGIIGTVLLVLILYAGYLWWSAGGNDEQVNKAKTTLRNAVIGIIIIFISYALTLFVFRTVLSVRVSGPAESDIEKAGEFFRTGGGEAGSFTLPF